MKLKLKADWLAVWICETIKMAHKYLVDNGFESPWEVVC